jgi:hypothetical protein
MKGKKEVKILRKKRAVIEMQFNWIFVLIVGAIIIAFFLTVVQKCKPIAEKQVSSTVISDIDAVITGAKEAKDTAGPIDIPNMEITFSCDHYSIGQSQKKVRTNIIFSPDRIIGEKLIPWSLDWGMPYRASNFLYLTSPQVRYILVGDNNNQIFKDINEMMTDKINKELIGNSGLFSLPDKNNYKVKLVFFEVYKEVPSNLKTKNLKDMTAIEIWGGTSPGKGTVNFFKRTGSTFTQDGSADYIGNEALIGAIFAEDREMYVCNMNKAYQRLNLVSGVYQQRTHSLSAWADTIGRTDCRDLYNQTSVQLDDILSASSPTTGNPPRSLDSSEISQIHSSSNNLITINSDLEGNSCPLIY